MMDILLEALQKAAIVLAVLIAVAASPFVMARVYDVMTGRDAEPRVTAEYWAERGYDTAGNTLPPTCEGEEVEP